MNILLVEDNLTIIKGLKYSFEKNNYNLVYRTNINDTRELLINNPKLDLIILDIMFELSSKSVIINKEHIDMVLLNQRSKWLQIS